MATKGEEGSSEAALGLEGSQMSSAQNPQEKSLEPANAEVKAQEPIGQNAKQNQSIDDDKTSFKEPQKSNSPGVDLLVGPEEAHVENSEHELIEHEALTHIDRGDPTDVKSAEEKDIKSDKLSEETEHVPAQEKTPALPIPESLDQELLAGDLDEILQTTNKNTLETPSKEQEEEKGEIAQSLDPQGLSGPPKSNIPNADLSRVGPESADVEVDPQLQGETESVDHKMEKIEEQQEEYSVVSEERPKDAVVAKNEDSEAESLTQQQKEVDHVDFEESTSIKADEQREVHKLAREEEPREDHGTKVPESTAKDVASEKGNFNSDEVLMKDENKQDTCDSLADETPKEESTNSELQTNNSYQQSTEYKCLQKEPRINLTVGENPEDSEDTPDVNPQASSATEDTKEHQDATKGYPGNNQEDETSFTISDSEAEREKTEAEGQGEHEERSKQGESAEETTQIFTDKDGSATEQQISDQEKLTKETSENSAEEKRPDVTARVQERNSDDLKEEASQTVIENNLVKEDAECRHSKEQSTTENIKILEITAEDATSEKETTRLHQENLLLKDDQETIVAYVDHNLKLPIDKKTLKDGEDLSFSENQEATISLKDDTPEECSREIDDGFQASISKEKEEDEMTTQFSAEIMNSGVTNQSLQSTTSSVDLLVVSEDDTQVEATPRSLEDNCESLAKSHEEEPSVDTDTTEEENVSTVPNIEVKKTIPQDGEKTIPDDESSKLGKPEEDIITYTDKDAKNEPEKGTNEDSEAVVQIEKEYAQDVVSAENKGTIIENLIAEPVDGHLENKILDAITTEKEEKEEACEQLQMSNPVKEETSHMNYDEQEKNLQATIPSVTQKLTESQEPSEQDSEGVVSAEDIYAGVIVQIHEGDSEDPATHIEKTSQPRSLVNDHQKPLENDQMAQENLNTSNVHSQAYQPNDQEEDRQATTPLFTKDINESQNPSEQDSEDAVAPETAYTEVSPQIQEGDNKGHGTQRDQEENRQATTALGTNDLNVSQVPSDRDGEDVAATEAAYAEVTSQSHGENSQDPDTQMEESCKPYKLDDNHQTPLLSDQSSQETLDKVDVNSQAYQPKDQEEKQQAMTPSVTRDTNEFQEPSERDGDDIVALEDAYEEVPPRSNERSCEDNAIQIETPSQAHTLVDDYLTPLESDHSAQEILNTIDVNSHIYQPKDQEEDQQGMVPPLTKNISESQEPSNRSSENVEPTEAAYAEVTSQSYQEDSQDHATPMESPSETHTTVENDQTPLVSDQSVRETLDTMDVNSQAYQSKDQEEEQQATTSLVTKDNDESQEPSEQDGSDVVVLEPTYEEVTPQSNEGDSQDRAVQIETPSQPHTFVDDYQTPLDLDQSTQESLNMTYANLQAYQPKDHEEDKQITGSSVAQDIKESQEPSERDGKYIVVPEATYAEVPRQSHERDSHDFPIQMEAPSQPQITINENQTPQELDHSTQETLNITDVHLQTYQLKDLVGDQHATLPSFTRDIKESREPNVQVSEHGEDDVAPGTVCAEVPPQSNERDGEDLTTKFEEPSQRQTRADNSQIPLESDDKAKETLKITDVDFQAYQPEDQQEDQQASVPSFTQDVEESQDIKGGEDVVAPEAINAEVSPQGHEGDSEDPATQIEEPNQQHTLIDDHQTTLESYQSTRERLNTSDVCPQAYLPKVQDEDEQGMIPSVARDIKESQELSEQDGKDVMATVAAYTEVTSQSHEEEGQDPANQMETPSKPHTPVNEHENRLESNHSVEEGLNTKYVDLQATHPKDHENEHTTIPSITQINDLQETNVAQQNRERDSGDLAAQMEAPSQHHTQVDNHKKPSELNHIAEEILSTQDVNSQTFHPNDHEEDQHGTTPLITPDINEPQEQNEHDGEEVEAFEADYAEVLLQSSERDNDDPNTQTEAPSQPHNLVDNYQNTLESDNNAQEILSKTDDNSQPIQLKDHKEATQATITTITPDMNKSQKPNGQDGEGGVTLQSHERSNEELATRIEAPSQPYTLVGGQENPLEITNNIQESSNTEDVNSQVFQPIDHEEDRQAAVPIVTQDVNKTLESKEQDGEVVATPEATYAEVPPQSREGNNEAQATQMELPSQLHNPVNDHSNKLESDNQIEKSLHAEDVHSRAIQPIDQKEEIKAVTTSITQDIKESEEPSERDDEVVVVPEATHTEVPPQSLEGDNKAPATQTDIPAQTHTPVDYRSNKLELGRSTEEILHTKDVHSQDFQPIDQKEEIEVIATSFAQDVKEFEEPSERDSEDVMAVEAAYEEVPPRSHEGDSEAPVIQMELPSQPQAPVDDHSNKVESGHRTEENLHAEDVHSRDIQPIAQKEVDTVTTSIIQDIKESEKPSERDDDVVVLEAAYTEVPLQSHEDNSEAPTIQMELPSQPPAPVNDHSNKMDLDCSTEEILHAEDVHSQDFQPTNQKEEIEATTTLFAQDIKESKEPRDSEDVKAVEAAYEEVPLQSHEGDSDAPVIQMELPTQPQAPVDDHSNKLELNYSTEEVLHAEDVHLRDFQPIDQKEEITTSFTQDIKEYEEPSERDSEDVMAVEAAYEEAPLQSHEGDSEVNVNRMEVPSQPHTPINDHSNKLESRSTEEILHTEDVHSQDFQPIYQKEEIEAIETSFTQDIKESEEPSERDSEDVMVVEAAYVEVPPQTHKGDNEAPVIQLEVPSQPHAPVNDLLNKLESERSTEEISHTEDVHSLAFQPIDHKEEREAAITSVTQDIKESEEPSEQDSEDVMAAEAAYVEVPPAIATSFTQDIKESEEPSEQDSEDVMVVEDAYVEVPPQSHEGDCEAPAIQLKVPSQPYASVNDLLNKLESERSTEEISHTEDVHSLAFQPIDHKEEREAAITSVTQDIKESEEPSEQDSEDVMAIEAVYVEVPPVSHEGDSEAPATKIEVPSQPHAPVDDHKNKLESDNSTDESLHAEDYHSRAFQPIDQKEEREAITTSVTQDIKESKEPSERDGEDCVAPDAANVEVSPQSYEGNNEDPATQIEEPTQPHILLDDQQTTLESDQSTQESLNIEYAHSQAIQSIDQKEEQEAITYLVKQDIKESQEPSEQDGEDVLAPETAYAELTSQSHEGNREDPPIQMEVPSEPHMAINDHQNKLESHQSTEDRLNTMDIPSQAVHPKDQENQQAMIPIITLEISESKEANEHGVESVVPEVAYVEVSSQSREEDTEDPVIQMEVPSQTHTQDEDHQNPMESSHIGQESLNTEDVNSEAFLPKGLEEIHQAAVPSDTEGINEHQQPKRQDGEGTAAPQSHTRVNEDPATQVEAPSQPHILKDDNQTPLELEHGYQENLNIENVNSQAFQIKDQEEDQHAKIPSITQDINESEGANERDGEGIMAPEAVDPEVTPQSHNGDSEGPATDPREDMSIDKSTAMAVTDKTKGEATEQYIPGQYEARLTVPSEETLSQGKAAKEDKDEDSGYGSPEHQEFKNSTRGNTAEKSKSAQIENESAKTVAISMNESSELEKLNEKATLTDVDQEYDNVTKEILNLTNFTNEMADTSIQNTQDPAILQKGDPTCFMEQEELTEELSEHSIEEKIQHAIATEHQKNSKDDLKEEADEPLEMNLVKLEAEHHHSQEQPREDHETNIPEALAGNATPELENMLLNEDKDNTISLPNNTAEKREPESECPQMSADRDTDRDDELLQAIDDDKTQNKETLDCNEDLVLLEGKGTTAASQDVTLKQNEAENSKDDLKEEADEPLEMNLVKEEAEHHHSQEQPREDHETNVPEVLAGDATPELENVLLNEDKDNTISLPKNTAEKTEAESECPSQLSADRDTDRDDELPQAIDDGKMQNKETLDCNEDLVLLEGKGTTAASQDVTPKQNEAKNSEDDLKEEADEPLEMNLVKEEAEHHHSQEQPREDHETNIPEVLAGDATPELENVLLNEDKDNTISLPNNTAEKREPESECPQMSADRDTDRDDELLQAIDDDKTQNKETLEDLVLLEGKGTIVASQDVTLKQNEAEKQEPNEEQQTVLSEESLDQGKQPEETTLEHIDVEEESRDVIIIETEKYSTDDLKEEVCDPLDGHKLVKEETEHLQSDQPRADHVNNIPASEAQNTASETKASDRNRAEIYSQSMLPSENQEVQIYLESMLMETNDSIQKEPEHQDLTPRVQVTVERDLLGQALIEDHFSQEILNTTDENSRASHSSKKEENRLATTQPSGTRETDKPPTVNDLVQPPEETYVEVNKQNLKQNGEDLANQVEAPPSGESTMRGNVDTDKGEDTNQNKNSSVVPVVDPMKEESEAKEQGQYGVEQTVPDEEGVNLGETVEETTSTFTDKEKGEDRRPTEEEVKEEQAKDADISKNKDFTFDNFSKEMAHESTLMKEDTDIPEENKGDATQNFSISEQEKSTEAREKSVEEKKQDAASAEQGSDLGKEVKEVINSFEDKENSREYEGSEEITTEQIEKEDIKDATFTENKEFNLVDDIIHPSAQKEATHGPAIKEENKSAMPTVTNLIEESTEGCLEKEKTEDFIVTQEESNPAILTEEMAQSQINKNESKEIIFTKQESLDEEKLPGEAPTAHSDEEKSQVDTAPEQEKICTDDLKERAEEPLEVNNQIEEETKHKIPTGHPTPDHDAKILETDEKKDRIISLVDKTLKEDATQSTESKVVPRSDGPNSAITLEPEEVKGEGTINSETKKAYMQPQENQGNEKDESQVIIMSVENQEVQRSIVSEAIARNVLLAENLEGKENESDVTPMKKVEESDFHKQDLEATTETSPNQTEMAEDNGLQSIKENQNVEEDKQAVEKGRTKVEGESQEMKPTAEESAEVPEDDDSQVDKNKQMGIVHLPVSQLLVDLILKEEGDKQYIFEEDTKGGFEGAENIKQHENSDPSLDKGEMEEPKSQDLIPAISEDTLILEDQDSEVVLPGRDILINIAKTDGLMSEISHEIPRDEKKNATAEKSETEEEVNNKEFVNSTLEIKEKSEATMSSENITQVGNEASMILKGQGRDKQKTESNNDGGKPSSADKVLPSSDTLINIAKNKGSVFEISQEVPQGEKKNSTAEKGEIECEVSDTDFEHSTPETKEKSDVITSSKNLTQVNNKSTLILEDQGIDNQNSESSSGGKHSSTDIVLPSSETLINIARNEGMVVEISHEVPHDEKKNATEEKSETESEVKEFANSTLETKEKSDVITMSESLAQVYNKDSLILENQDSDKQNTESNIDGSKTIKTNVLLPGPEILIDIAQDKGLVPEKKIETEERSETGHEIKDKDTINSVPETKENSDALLLSKTVNKDIQQEKEVQKSDTISENHPRIEIQNKALMRDLSSEMIETETSKSQGSKKPLLSALNPTPEPKSPVTEVNKVKGEASELKLEGKERTPIDDRKDGNTVELCFGERAVEETKETEPTDRDFHKQEMTMEGKNHPMSLEKSSKDVTQDGSEEEKYDEGEERDEEEHKADKSAMDVSEKAETIEGDPKSPHKKSHNILSGVTSKVKHSIAKVKKAITGKPSHSKSPVAKEHT